MDEVMQLLVGSWQWQTWTLPESGHANLIWKPNNLHQLAMQLVCSSSHTRSFTPAGGKPMLSIDVVDTSIGAACFVDWQTFFTLAGFEPSTNQATTEGFDLSATAAAVDRKPPRDENSKSDLPSPSSAQVTLYFFY